VPMTSRPYPSAPCMLVRSQVGCSSSLPPADRGLRCNSQPDTELAAAAASTTDCSARQSGLPAPGDSVVSAADNRSQHKRHRRCSRCTRCSVTIAAAKSGSGPHICLCCRPLPRVHQRHRAICVATDMKSRRPTDDSRCGLQEFIPLCRSPGQRGGAVCEMTPTSLGKSQRHLPLTTRTPPAESPACQNGGETERRRRRQRRCRCQTLPVTEDMSWRTAIWSAGCLAPLSRPAQTGAQRSRMQLSKRQRSLIRGSLHRDWS